jgi:predicted O-methyltransferase YrrM
VDLPIPGLVSAATRQADSVSFRFSCDPAVGRLLAVLAAHLEPGARVLELGTGMGVGTAWIVSGLLPRTDVTVITVEKDESYYELAGKQDWPAFVDRRSGDALEALAILGTFDLIFADAPRGKWEGVDRTIAALRPGGLLVVDDMNRRLGTTASHRTAQDELRRLLLTSSLLHSVDMRLGSGVILGARRP